MQQTEHLIKKMPLDSTNNRRPVLVLGIGNILLHDEGIGVYAIRELQKISVPDYVETLDGGTAGADLLDHISDRVKVIVVDAVDANIPPAAVLRLKPADLVSDTRHSISLHEFGLAETIAMARHLNCAPRDVVIFGVKPKNTTPGLGLSSEMTNVLPFVIDCIFAEIQSMNN